MYIDRFQHYKTGYQAIDDEHLKMFQLMDAAMVECRKPGATVCSIQVALCELEEYVLLHMDNEEKLMRDARFKYIQCHIDAHNEIRKQLPKLLHRSSDEKHFGLFEYVVKNFEQLFVFHIDSYDMQIRLEPVPADRQV